MRLPWRKEEPVKWERESYVLNHTPTGFRIRHLQDSRWFWVDDYDDMPAAMAAAARRWLRRR